MGIIRSTATLSGPRLDQAVAMALGWCFALHYDAGGGHSIYTIDGRGQEKVRFALLSRDGWGGRVPLFSSSLSAWEGIIERYEIRAERLTERRGDLGGPRMAGWEVYCVGRVDRIQAYCALERGDTFPEALSRAVAHSMFGRSVCLP